MKITILLLGFFCAGCVGERTQKDIKPETETVESKAPAPATPSEAIAYLKTTLRPERLDGIKKLPESKIAAVDLDLRLGIVNYLLPRGSALRMYFNKQGVYDREDMAYIVLILLWRSLNELPINAEDQIEQYKAKHLDKNS